MKPAPVAPNRPPMPSQVAGRGRGGSRDKLRAMMRPRRRDGRIGSASSSSAARAPAFTSGCKGTALTGTRELFQTALADALGIDFRQAQAHRPRDSDFADLLTALNSWSSPEEHAFLIAAALYPQRFGHAEAIRLFLERYRLIHREAAADKLRGWKEATLAAACSRSSRQPSARPTAGQQSRQTRGVRQGAEGVVKKEFRVRTALTALTRKPDQFLRRAVWPGSISTTQMSLSKRASLAIRASIAAASASATSTAELALVGPAAVIGRLRRRPEQGRGPKPARVTTKIAPASAAPRRTTAAKPPSAKTRRVRAETQSSLVTRMMDRGQSGSMAVEKCRSSGYARADSGTVTQPPCSTLLHQPDLAHLGIDLLARLAGHRQAEQRLELADRGLGLRADHAVDLHLVVAECLQARLDLR